MSRLLPFEFLSVENAVSLIKSRGSVLNLMDECGFFLCQRGTIDVSIDDKTYLMQEGYIYYYLPSTYVSILNSSPDLEGILVKCNVDFVMPLTQHMVDSGHYFALRANPCIQLNERQRTSIESLTSLLRTHRANVTVGGPNPGVEYLHRELIISLAQSLFYEIMYVYSSSQPVSTQVHTARDNVFQKFLTSLFRNFKTEREVNFYAEELSLTPRYFSSIIKDRSGHSALQWIVQMVISSAKQELINTDKSIKEISEEFHFPTQSFFGKYFKQYVGVSPKAFRKQQRTGLSVDLDSDE